MTDIKRICLWSGPRNISTALMYSFAQRADTAVFDEPFYGYYLKNSNAEEYHPGAKEVMAEQELNPSKLIEWALTESRNPVLFFKHMTHHLLDMDRSFLKSTINVILTREPKPMLASFAKVIPNPTMADVGYQLHLDLIEDLKKLESPFYVLDSKDVLIDPEAALTKLCDFAGIPFDKSMLSWKAGARPEDGSWAKYWYDNVHKSTGFQEYEPKEIDFPTQLIHLLAHCERCYQALIGYSKH